MSNYENRHGGHQCVCVSDMHQISAVENPAHRIDESDYAPVEGAEGWYDDLDELIEQPDDGGMADDQSDISDYEEQMKSRRKRKVSLSML